MTTRKGWRHDWAVHPGEILRESMEERGWTQARLASEVGVKPSYISDVIRGRRGISTSLAMRLEPLFADGSARFWLHLQVDYDLAIARGPK